MKIVILPFILTMTPPLLLILFLNYWTRTRTLLTLTKVILGILFLTIGVATSIYATIISIDGISEKGVQCATGAATFLGLGFMANFGGVPLLLALYRNVKK